MTDLDGAGIRDFRDASAFKDARQARDGSAAAGPDPDSVREEAERLVAAGLAAVSMAADRIGAPTRERGGAAAAGYDAIGDMLFGRAGHRRHSVANGSEDCCRCPVCRTISAAREPSPRFAETVATGFGTLAQGAARLLRGVAEMAGQGTPAGAGREAGPDTGTGRGTDRGTGGDAAHPTRTVAGPAGGYAGAEPDDDPWAAATADQATAVRPGDGPVSSPAGGAAR